MKIRVYTRRKIFSIVCHVQIRYYWRIALQMEHCLFANNIEFKMGILELIRKIYFNLKTLTKTIFLSLYTFS